MKKSLTILALSLCAASCDSSSSSKSKPITEEEGEAGNPDPKGEADPDPEGEDAVGDGSDNESGEGGDANQAQDPGGGPLNLQLGLSTSKGKYLAAIGTDLAAHALAFRDASAQVEAQSLAYCAQPTPETLAAAQQSWKNAMSVWQHFELFQIGPIAENAKVLKFNIYAWPDAANICKVDEEALKASKTTGYRLPPQPNRRGLQALEYLLFESSLDSACATVIPQTNATKAVTQEWNALSLEQKWATRCAYLKPVSADLAIKGADLLQRWGTADDNVISRQIGNPAAEAALIQSLYDNLFYTDIELKNSKLAAPAGHDLKHCANSPLPCPGKEEFKFAGFSREAININLRAFADLMFGPEVPQREGGFTALIRAEGQAGVADKSESIVSALTQLSTEEKGTSLNDLIGKQGAEDCSTSQVSYLCRMRAGLKAIAAELKYEYSKIMNLKVPEGPAGDND